LIGNRPQSATFHTATVMPHPKKTETTMTEKMKHQKANASAKSKELHPMLKANTMQHICFCPNRTLKISNKL